MVSKQGRIHGNPVADGWAGAVMQKTLGIQKCDGWTDRHNYRPTDRHGKVKSRVSATKKILLQLWHLKLKTTFYRVFHTK